MFSRNYRAYRATSANKAVAYIKGSSKYPLIIITYFIIFLLLNYLNFPILTFFVRFLCLDY